MVYRFHDNYKTSMALTVPSHGSKSKGTVKHNNMDCAIFRLLGFLFMNLQSKNNRESFKEPWTIVKEYS